MIRDRDTELLEEFGVLPNRLEKKVIKDQGVAKLDMTKRSEGIHLSRQTPDLLGQETCSGTIECALAGVADQALLAGWLLLLILVAATSLFVLPRARELCEEERRRTKAEYHAFDSFLDHLNRIETTTGSVTRTDGGTARLLHKTAAEPADQLETVRKAYRATVMDVPHYEEDYDESLEEHMRAELSDELAHGSTCGTEFSPHLKRGLLEATRDARDRREKFLGYLEEEARSLEHHEARIESITEQIETATAPRCSAATFDELLERRETLLECEDRLQTVIEDRQNDRTTSGTAAVRSRDGRDLPSYLYRELDVTYPVLAEVTKLLGQLRTGTNRLEDELIHRG